MTKDEMLQEIERDVRRVCENLTRFEVGCLIRFSDNLECPLRIVHFDSGDVYLWDIVNRITLKRKADSVFRNCEIIGKDPTLHDILRWLLAIEGDTDFIDMQGCFGKWSNGMVVKTDFAKWDFTKPFLKNQSDIVVSFLWWMKGLAGK